MPIMSNPALAWCLLPSCPPGCPLCISASPRQASPAPYQSPHHACPTVSYGICLHYSALRTRTCHFSVSLAPCPDLTPTEGAQQMSALVLELIQFTTKKKKQKTYLILIIATTDIGVLHTSSQLT